MCVCESEMQRYTNPVLITKCCYDQCATGSLDQVHCTADGRLGYHANGVLCSKGHTNELLYEHILLLLSIQEIVVVPV